MKLSGCKFGMIYTRNDSKWPLKETLQVNLKGAEVIWPKSRDMKTFELDIAPNSDHIVVFRQTEGVCSYGYTPKVHKRIKTRDELLALTKEIVAKPLGETAVKCHLYNKIDAACLYLDNQGA